MKLAYHTCQRHRAREHSRADAFSGNSWDRLSNFARIGVEGSFPLKSSHSRCGGERSCRTVVGRPELCEEDFCLNYGKRLVQALMKQRDIAFVTVVNCLTSHS